jgi:hypothetical protein
MSIVIALIVVLVVGGLVANYYPKPNKSTLAQGEILTPESTEETPEPTPVPEVVEETIEVVIPTTPPSTPTMKAKKKPHHKKKPAKTNA